MKFALFCGLVFLGFTGLELFSVDLFPSAAHAVIPASVRSSPGGYRSYHFWHTGFSGGK